MIKNIKTYKFQKERERIYLHNIKYHKIHNIGKVHNK